MSSINKQINISTTLSNLDNIVNNYGLTYQNSIICKYLKSNPDKLINFLFTEVIDNIYMDNKFDSVTSLLNYSSNSAFQVIYNISEVIENIPDCAFHDCCTLTSISNIPETFKSIDDGAFSGCTNLKTVNLPKSITEIGSFAFSGTPKLQELNISNVTKIHNYSFAGCGLSEFNLNQKINYLNDYVFKDCRNLKKFIDPYIVSVGKGVFANCTNLEYVEMSNWYQYLSNFSAFIEEEPKIVSGYVYVGEEYDFYFYVLQILNEQGDEQVNMDPTSFSTVKVRTVENNSDNLLLENLMKFEIIELTGENSEELMNQYFGINKFFYAEKNAFLDESGNKYYIYTDDSGATHFDERFPYKISLVKTESEEEDIPITKWRLYDNEDVEIGYITENLANKIRAYEKNGLPIATFTDNGNGVEVIQLLYPITYIEYYIDGETLTGKTYTDASQLSESCPRQMINLYRCNGDSRQPIDENTDINVDIVFNEDFTECYFKYACYPVYDKNDEYLCYYLFEQILNVRKEYDNNLIFKEGTNEGALVDLGFYVIESISGNKYPVYNLNYCFIGILNNGQFLEYTNEVELETYLSRLQAISIADENAGESGLRYFMLPANTNYTEEEILDGDISEEIREIIQAIVNKKNGVDESEEEEIILSYKNFTTSVLQYQVDEEYRPLLKIPDYMFANCISLNNHNILRNGNYNYAVSKAQITFTNTKDAIKKYYLGTWKDIVTFFNYLPANNEYIYAIKWKYIKINDVNYIQIILNNTCYYIYEIAGETYKQYLVDDIDNPSFIDNITFMTDASIFDSILFNNTYEINPVGYQKSIYDKYYLLDTVNEIGIGAFMNCVSIHHIENKFETINKYAFKDCINLESINLSQTKNLGKYAFENCVSLKEVNLPLLSTHSKTNSDGVFYNCRNLIKVNGFEASKISKYMFKNCQALDNINLNDSVEIGKEAFFNCYNLTIDETNNIGSATIIEDYAFGNCRKLTSLNLNENIQKIGIGAFKGCINLTEVTLPASITNLTDELFIGCTNLEKLVINYPITEEIKLSALDYCDNLSYIEIAAGGRYMTPNNNCIFDTVTNTIIYVAKNFDNSNTVPTFDISFANFLVSNINISEYAFNNCDLQMITISNDIKINNLNINIFKGIKYHNYRILISKQHEQYKLLYEILGNKKIYLQ